MHTVSNRSKSCIDNDTYISLALIPELMWRPLLVALGSPSLERGWTGAQASSNHSESCHGAPLLRYNPLDRPLSVPQCPTVLLWQLATRPSQTVRAPTHLWDRIPVLKDQRLWMPETAPPVPTSAFHRPDEVSYLLSSNAEFYCIHPQCNAAPTTFITVI